MESVVSQSGIQLFVYDCAGKPIPVDRVRGVAALQVAGNPKRYRYDLLPDGKGGLTAPVNLTAIAGLQVEIDIQLVEVPGTAGRPLMLHELAAVPASSQQLAASAIARQKICPVSGKPLGSMGDPLAIDVRGQQIYVCCAGCVSRGEGQSCQVCEREATDHRFYPNRGRCQLDCQTSEVPGDG